MCNINAVIKANIFNNIIFNQILNNDGFQDITDIISVDYVRSQHYIFCTYLLNFISNKEGVFNIIDIGGGFGNIRRIISKYMKINSYTIIDIDNCLQFNKSFLKTYNNTYELFENKYISECGFYNISLSFRDLFINNFLEKNNIDVLIATHSLSKLDMDEFDWYLNNVVSKSKLFFYCTQTLDTCHNPCGAEISLLKIKKIKEIMNTILEIGQPGEEGNCMMYLFESYNNNYNKYVMKTIIYFL